MPSFSVSRATAGAADDRNWHLERPSKTHAATEHNASLFAAAAQPALAPTRSVPTELIDSGQTRREAGAQS
jgi:hypothetical protein